MANEKVDAVVPTVVELEHDGRKYLVTKPNKKDELEAVREHDREYIKLFRADALLTPEVEKMARARKLWDDERQESENKIKEELIQSERVIKGYVPDKDLDDKKKAAVRMSVLRAELSDLRSVLDSLTSLTAESKARELKFNFLFVKNFRLENKKQVYQNVEDYLDKGEDNEVADKALKAFYKLYLGYDFEEEYKKRPEYKFLVENKLTNEKGEFINEDGEKVNADGKRINDKGQLVNEDGVAINKYGDFIGEEGELLEKPTVSSVV